jgi:RNA polymerase sigma-70 factor (ECF subfamily)
VTSVVSVVLAVLILSLVRHPGGWAMSGWVHDQGRRQAGGQPRAWLATEAAAHLPVPGASGTGALVGTTDPELLDDLVQRAKAGEVEAFGELFDRFHSVVFRQLFAQTRSRALAEDLTSETFFRALRAVAGFPLPSRLFEPWLRTIARNLASDHYRSRHTRYEVTTADEDRHEGAFASAEDLVVESLDHESLRGALLCLPANQRHAVTLRFLDQLSVAETAVALGCSEGAAKQLQWRGLRNLARLLRDELAGS